MDMVNQLQKAIDELTTIEVIPNLLDKIETSKIAYSLLCELPVKRTLSPKNRIDKSILLAISLLEVAIIEPCLFDMVISKASINIEVAYSQIVNETEVKK